MAVGAFSFDEPVRQESLVPYTVRKRESTTVDEPLTFDLSIEILDEFLVYPALSSRVVVKSDVERFE